MKASLRQNINIGYEKYNKLNNVKISASFGVRKIIGVICGYGKSASSHVYKLLLSTCLTIPNQLDKSRKANWTREEECSLINEIESAGEILRGSGNSAHKNRKPERLEGAQILLDR